jgi:hypothetical protein
MSSVEHPLALNSEQHHAFSERVAWDTALVINGVRTEGKSETGQNVSSEGVGVGSACCWKDKRLILTAKHVLEGANPTDVRFFLRPDGQIDWNTRPSQPSGAQAIVLEIEDLVRCPSEDLACIVLGPNESGRNLEFADLATDFGEVPPDGSGTLIFGCPSDKSLPIAEGQQADGVRWRALAVQPRGCWAVVVGEPPRFFPSSFDPARHFLLRYDPVEEGSLPYGFSGAGVWYQNSKKREIWAANPVLAGVQKEWHGESNLMIGIRSEVVRHFLEEFLA